MVVVVVVDVLAVVTVVGDSVLVVASYAVLDIAIVVAVVAVVGAAWVGRGCRP